MSHTAAAQPGSSALNITREEAQARAAVLDVDSYRVELDLTGHHEAPTFAVTTTVRFSAQTQSSTFIDFVSDDVASVVLNGTELGPESADGTRITLGPLAAHNELIVTARAKYMNTGEGLHRFIDPVDGEIYLYSQFEVPDARRMFPVFEQPDLKAEFTFVVAAPQHWSVVSNQPAPPPSAISQAGFAVENPDSAVLYEFSPTPRISSYITALIAGPYRSAHSELTSSDGRTIPLGVYCRASLFQYLDAENIFTTTRQGFEFYESQFSTAYPFEKYDQLFVPEFNAGAMENAGAVTFLENYVFRGTVAEALVERRAITVLHELAHMWFGDLVTMGWWNDLWLNESFAEFMSHLAAAENTGHQRAWTTFAATEKSWAYRQDQLSTTHPITAEIRDLDDVLVNFDGITYAKGASVLRQLVAWVGRENFMAGVRQYFSTHAWGNTELADLMRPLQTASGRDLTAWTKTWLETSGVNTLRTHLETDDDGTITSLRLLQTGEILRPHRLAVGFYRREETATGQPGRLVRHERFELDVDDADTDVTEAVGLRRPAVILLNDDDLAYTKIRLDSASWSVASTQLSAIEGSLPRALLWGAAWDTTRDGEATSEWFIDLVLTHISTETDSSVMQSLLRQVATALAQYTPAEQISRLRAETADGLWALARRAAPGGDAQLQFLKAFVAQARGAQLNTVTGLYDDASADNRAAETAVLAGLDLTTDLRWELLIALVAGGKAGDEDIVAAEHDDATASGALAAVQARAAVPTAEAKQHAWEQILTGELSNTTQRNVVAGFKRVHDHGLLAPYVQQYFAMIETIWGSRSHEMAETVAIGLFPTWSVDQATVNATRQAINTTQYAGLRRVLTEALDDLHRALSARRR